MSYSLKVDRQTCFRIVSIRDDLEELVKKVEAHAPFLHDLKMNESKSSRVCCLLKTLRELQILWFPGAFITSQDSIVYLSEEEEEE